MESFRKTITIGLIIMLLLFVLPACSPGSNVEEPGEEAITEEIQNENSAADTENDEGTLDESGEASGDEEEISMKMTINDTPVQVAWENNASVKALAKMTESGPVTIETEPYGGFEQVGSIGATLPSSDTNIKTKAGDIMLYTGSQMVIFYGSNSWAYTRLGKITDKFASELKDLLGGSGVTVTVTAK